MVSGVKAKLGDGSSGDPIAQVLGSTLEAYSGALRSLAAVGSLALELCYGSLLELYTGHGSL